MKILIYGGNGWIGGLFTEYIDNNQPDVKYCIGNARVDSIDSLIAEIDFVVPTHIISFIGRTHGTTENGVKINSIDYLEYPGKLFENVRDNLYGPLTLADICTKKNIHYTYLGTGCIFNTPSPIDSVSYTERSLPNYFGSSYSIVKGFTDRLMKNYPVLNLRIRMPISSQWNDRNFITKIVKYSKICSIPNSMTVLDDFFPIFLDLMKRGSVGTYNCTNPGLIEHNEILEMYKSNILSTHTWENITLSDQSRMLLSERSNNLLDTSVISALYPDLKPIKESVSKIINSFKKE